MRKYYLSCSFCVLTLLLSFIAIPGLSDAKKNSTLTKDEARQVLAVIMPDVQIISVDKAAIEGLWEVAVQSGGKKGIVYLNKTRNKVIFGSIIDITTKKNITKEKFDEINKVDVSLIPLDDALVMGDAQAKHKVIVFDDPD